MLHPQSAELCDRLKQCLHLLDLSFPEKIRLHKVRSMEAQLVLPCAAAHNLYKYKHRLQCPNDLGDSIGKDKRLPCLGSINSYSSS